jgi:hypothetical protein
MKIILDEKEVPLLVPESLPMLIHGAEGSGASMYTVALAAKWFTQGYKVLFLCGYAKAEDEFTRLVGGHDSVKFYTKDNSEQFKHDVARTEAIVIVKNIELFDSDVLDAISTNLFILSGDLSKASFKDIIFKKKFTTEVYFSKLDDKELPVLNKYEGFVVSGEYQGITKLSL